MSDSLVRREGDAGNEVSTSTLHVAPSAHLTTLAPRGRERIKRFLVVKAALELLFVLALAAVFFYLNFNPGFEGAILSADSRRIEGWVAGSAGSSSRVEIQLYVDGKFAASTTADRELSSVDGVGASGGRGFVFDLPPLAAGEHEARVFAVHVGGSEARRTLHPVGAPARVSVKTGAE